MKSRPASSTLIDVQTYQSTQQIEEYDEARREAAEFAKGDKLT